MKIIFWASLFCVFYAYAGYMLVLILISFFKKQKIKKDTLFYPHVSLIIAAYNEEKCIGKKIEESLALDYPKEKLEIIIASDASTDKTEEIIKSFEDRGIKLIRNPHRGGKTAVQNLAIEKAQGEILVFSDATTIFDKDTVSKLVGNFSDENVGCVGGEEIFLKAEKGISDEAGFFWRYEKFLRRLESDFNTLIGVSGCVFAIRKKLYRKLPNNVIEDFALPLEVASKGLKCVCEPQARAYEEAAKNTKHELMRKARIVSGGISVLVNMKYLLNPFKHPLLSFQLISHKVLRWLAPIFMIILFISNVFLLQEYVYRFIFIGQAFFYFLATIGSILNNLGKAPRLFRLISHFCAINAAAVWGLAMFLKGEKKAIWQTVR